MILSLLIYSALAGQLAAADISVDVPTGAIRATYRLTSPSDTVRFHAARAETGDLVLLSPPRALHQGRGAYSLGLPVTAGVEATVELIYRIAPGSVRIPIFVPDIPTQAAGGAVTIRVSGVSAAARLGDGFPRMFRVDGAVFATPANVPSFIAIPPAGGSIGINRWADAFVVLLLVGSSGWWLVRRRRA